MFQQTTLKLVGVAFGCAVFTGVRGGLFTLGMARLNLRIRTRLFHSLLRQDIGFFDTTKTGEITSRSATNCTHASTSSSFVFCTNFQASNAGKYVIKVAYCNQGSSRMCLSTRTVCDAGQARHKHHCPACQGMSCMCLTH